MKLYLPDQNLTELPDKKFPPEIEFEAHALEFTDELFEDREEIHGFTIDAPESPDLDDAIQLRKTAKGWLADITISDVDSLVSKDSYIDHEALCRVATQYYSKTKRSGEKEKSSTPMIPRVLSENRLSLHEGKLRPTMTVQVELNDLGKILSITIKKTFLRSTKRMSHSEYEGTKIVGDPGLPMNDYLYFSKLLSQNRWQEGSLGYQEIRKGLNTDEEGMIIRGSVPAANQIVQEFMILANRAVAMFFQENQIAAPFRVHAPSDGNTPTRQQIIEEVERTSDYLKLVDNLRSIFNKSLSGASYSPEADQHFGLGLNAYLHFTSPIRRYADLINHRIAKALIAEDPLPYSKEDVERLCRYLDERTRRIITLRSIKSGSHSFYNYRENPPKSAEAKSQKHTNQLIEFLADRRIGNPVFEFSAKPGIHVELTCSVAVRFQKVRYVETFTARADKETVKDQAARRLLKVIKKLHEDFYKDTPEESFEKKTPSDSILRTRFTPSSELFRYCQENNLPSPNFHYEIWNGGTMPITCHCQITDQLAVTGHGGSRVKSKQDAAQKLLNYLQAHRPTIKPPQLDDQNI